LTKKTGPGGACFKRDHVRAASYAALTLSVLAQNDLRFVNSVLSSPPKTIEEFVN